MRMTRLHVPTLGSVRGRVDRIAVETDLGDRHRVGWAKRRKFVIADTPGHTQYTRNMVTGASTANLAIILVDAHHGLVKQSRRHAFIASLLRIPHLVFAVNKMDLVGRSEDVFLRIEEDFRNLAARMDVTDVTFIPISALTGANVVYREA